MARTKTLLALAVFGAALVLVVLVSVFRYSGDPSEGGSFSDFRDAGYFGAQALVDGQNPYDVIRYFDRYPVGQEYPLLPPTYAVLHIPLLLLDLLPAAVLFFVLNVAAMVALSAWSLRLAGWRLSLHAVLLTAALLLVSNGGRFNLIVGQATVLWVAATYAAITARRDQEWLGTGGVAVALTKPTFGLPIGLLLLGWGRSTRAVLGAAVAGAVSLLLLIPIVAWAGGSGPFLDTLRGNWDASQLNTGASLETTTARVDVAATIRQFTGWVAPGAVEALLAVAVLGAAFVVIRRGYRQGVSWDALAVLACLATITGIYHVYYDLVLLLLPVLLVLRPAFAGSTDRRLRLTLLVAMLVANFNVFHSLTFAERVPENVGRALGPGVTGLALVVALLTAAAVVMTAAHRSPTGGVTAAPAHVE